MFIVPYHNSDVETVLAGQFITTSVLFYSILFYSIPVYSILFKFTGISGYEVNMTAVINKLKGLGKSDDELHWNSF